MAKLNICTSNASSAHPPKQAQKVRFSFGGSAEYHDWRPASDVHDKALDILFLHPCLVSDLQRAKLLKEGMGEASQSGAIQRRALPTRLPQTIEVRRWNQLGMRAACSLRAGHAKQRRGS
jgi:hypothetical protein